MKMALLALSALAIAAQPAAASAPTCATLAAPDLEDRIVGVSKVWKEADYNFAFFDQVPDLDWDEEYRKALRAVARTDTMDDYYRVLQRMVASLSDGHSNVYWPETMPAGCIHDEPRLRLTAIDGRAFVTNVDRSLAEEIPPGSEIVAVDGMDVPTALEQNVYPYLSSSADHARTIIAIEGWSFQRLGLLSGPTGSVASLEIVDPSGNRRTVEAPRERLSSGQTEWVRERSALPENGTLSRNGDVAILTITSFGDNSLPEKLAPLWPEIRRARGLVIDIAHNGGGNTDNAYPLIERIASSEARGATWRSRKHVAAFRAWAPHLEEYAEYGTRDAWHYGEMGVVEPLGPEERLDMPVAIVTSWRTGSAAEDFAIYLDSQPNVRRVGQATYGSTGQPLFFDLPGGGRARIVTKRDTYPDGRDFVGYGVEPDLEVLPTIADIMAGNRPDLDAAIADVRRRADEYARAGG